MKKDRKVICDIISKMLDNPGEGEIYPTGIAYDKLEQYIEQVRKDCLTLLRNELKKLSIAIASCKGTGGIQIKYVLDHLAPLIKD